MTSSNPKPRLENIRDFATGEAGAARNSVRLGTGAATGSVTASASLFAFSLGTTVSR